MKKLIAIAALLAATAANADVVDDAIKGTADHVVAPVANEISKRMMRALAQGKGPMAEAARANLKQQDLAEKEANRGVRRSVFEPVVMFYGTRTRDENKCTSDVQA